MHVPQYEGHIHDRNFTEPRMSASPTWLRMLFAIDLTFAVTIATPLPLLFAIGLHLSFLIALRLFSSVADIFPRRQVIDVKFPSRKRSHDQDLQPQGTPLPVFVLEVKPPNEYNTLDEL